MKKIIPLVLLLMFAASCGSSVDTQALRDEVLDIHDEVMPKMGEIMSLKKKVLARSEEVSDSSEVDNLKALAEQLDGAYSGMMKWMNDWSKGSRNFLDQDAKPIAGVEVVKVVEYLEDEKTKVSKVRDAINNSIKDAKEVLEPASN